MFENGKQTKDDDGWTPGDAYTITKTRPCNILQFFTAFEKIIFI